MDHQTNINQIENSIALPVTVVQQAFERAQHLGVDLSEYILSLITNDLSQPLHRSWLEPLPTSVSQRYDQDVVEFLTIEIQTPHKSAHTGQELADLLDKEIENLADD